MPSTIDPIILNTIGKRHDVVKKIINCLLQDLLQREVGLILMFSNMSTIKVIIKWTAILVHISKTISIKMSIVENNRNSMKLEYSNVVILLVLV